MDKASPVPRATPLVMASLPFEQASSLGQGSAAGPNPIIATTKPDVHITFGVSERGPIEAIPCPQSAIAKVIYRLIGYRISTGGRLG